MGFYTLESGQGSSSEDNPKRMSPSAAPPQKNPVMTSSCSEGPGCPSRAHRHTPDPGPRPRGGTPRCLTFTLAAHHGSGRAHPHLQVSVENAEEVGLDWSGRAWAERGVRGGVTPAPWGLGVEQTYGEPSQYTAQARPILGAAGYCRLRCLNFFKWKEEDPSCANSYFCELIRSLFMNLRAALLSEVYFETRTCCIPQAGLKLFFSP